MNSDGHYLVVISVAKCSDRHYNLPQISLPGSDLHYSFFYSVLNNHVMLFYVGQVQSCCDELSITISVNMFLSKFYYDSG